MESGLSEFGLELSIFGCKFSVKGEFNRTREIAMNPNNSSKSSRPKAPTPPQRVSDREEDAEALYQAVNNANEVARGAADRYLSLATG
jgi:hypothetical protein